MNQPSGAAAPPGHDFMSWLHRVGAVIENIRTHDWWEFKIPPLLGTAYATALIFSIPFQQLWPLLALLLFTIVPAAAYVSVLNDITDLKDDLQCVKSNRMAGKSNAFKFIVLAACLVPGLIAAWLLRNDPYTLLFYSGTWIAYTLYSVPPFRLKIRGAWGIAMDASGAHLFPTLWAASLIAEATGHAIPWIFIGALAIWSFALGLRGILWHQLYDRENDLRGEVATFVSKRNPESVVRFVAWILFPLEMAALGFILSQVDTIWAWVMLAAYLIIEYIACRMLEISLILVEPTLRFRIIFAEYYQLWFPMTFLIALTQQSLPAVFLILLQLALFPHCFYVFLRHLKVVVYDGLYLKTMGKLRQCYCAFKNS
jgi:hypothetical protein